MQVLESLPHATPEVQERACEQAALLVSLENLLTFPWIAKRVEEGTLALHGWFFDMEKGKLLRYDGDEDSFVELVTAC
jgi:carbonic anhydrase